MSSRWLVLRRWFLVGGGMLVVVAAGLAGVAAWLLRDPEPRFARRRSSLATVAAGPVVRQDGSLFRSVRLTAASGLAVSLTTRRELADRGKRPLLLLLGGHVTGADAVKLTGPTSGVLLAAMSYPYDGEPRPSSLTFLREIPAIRGAFLDTPPALSLALDYLLTLPEVDATRVELVGVSLGAPFVTIAGARDARVSRVWAIHGAAGAYGPLEASMRRTIRLAPLRALAAGTAAVIIAGPRLAPERWVARIAPRPFVMVNALDDERMSRAAVDALYRSARDPRELIWMPGAHIHGDRPTIERLVAIVLPRVVGP